MSSQPASTQAECVGQEFPHLPQLLGSVSRFVQPLKHFVSPVGQVRQLPRQQGALQRLRPGVLGVEEPGTLQSLGDEAAERGQ